MTVAAFMDLALYDPRFGYYARAAQRSGRAGDFFTSVDVGPVFGELLETQIAEMAGLLSASHGEGGAFDLVEAGAGNGRLSADILRSTARRDPALYTRDAVAPGRCERQRPRRATRPSWARLPIVLRRRRKPLPETFEGVLLANELLDALPVHQVVMRDDGLREVYVTAGDHGLRLAEGPVSTRELVTYFERLGATLEPGWRVEVNLRAREWLIDVARRLRRGFIILIDYGHPAHELYAATHAGGTLTTFSRHTMAGPETRSSAPAWLQRPGEQDITSHVDFTTVQMTAEAHGLTTLALLDQTYFLMGLLEGNLIAALSPLEQLKRRLALKTLLLPGGLGSTFKVLILGKDVGAPSLKGCAYRVRVT